MSKVYRKSLLAVMVAAALPVIVVAATDGDTTIYVTTTADDNNKDLTTCSLREAVIAASTNKAYGGCIAGQYAGTDKIKFKEGGTYVLKSPIEIDSRLTISGADAVTYDRPDAVTGTVPARTQLKTIIKGDGTFPLFSSITQQSPIDLSSVILQNGGGTKGGAIRAGGVVTLNRVYIMNSKADTQGGAIYLDGTSSSLSVVDSIFYSNNAPRGAILAMSCLDSLGTTKRSITFDRTSIINNGSSTSDSIIDYCGAPTGSITASTIANNTVSTLPPDNNADPKVPPKGIIRYIHVNNDSPLDINSSIGIQSNTIVQNTGWATLLYDNVGTLQLSYNVLAFNKAGKSCRYLQKELTGTDLQEASAKVRSVYDAIVIDKGAASTNPVDECYLPILKTDTSTTTPTEDKRYVYDLTSVRNKFGVLFYSMPIVFNEDNLNNADWEKYGYMPVFIPRKAVDGDVNNPNKLSLIDVAGTGCTTYDQRGMPRNLRLATTNRAVSGNTCDKGAIEISRLYAPDVTGATNVSILALIDDMDSTIKNNEATLDTLAADSPYILNYKQAIADQKLQLASLKIVDKNNPLTQRYRQAYVSIFPTAAPKETLSPNIIYNFLNNDGTFNDKDYVVTAQAVGRAPKSFIETIPADPSEIKDTAITDQAKYITCVWNPALRQVMVSRLELDDNNTPDDPKDDFPVAVRTPEGSAEYCSYTISLVKGKGPSRTVVDKFTGYIQASIINVAPVAKDDKYTLKYGDPSAIQMDILANDNDDGDGAADVPGYPKGRNVFYDDPETNSHANIKITSSGIVATKTGFRTSLGIVSFQYVQPCPNSSTTTQDETCYGGKMSYQPDNVFSPFNDSFKYKVLDADKAESNEATVSIINTATTTDDTRGNSGGSNGSGGGGGGSIGWLALAGLGVLAAARRRLTR